MDHTLADLPAKSAQDGADGTVKRGSNSRSYITARLERDGHRDLAAAVRSGTLSAFRAAVQAGIAKPPPTPLEKLQHDVMKLDRASFRLFFTWLLTTGAKAHR